MIIVTQICIISIDSATWAAANRVRHFQQSLEHSTQTLELIASSRRLNVNGTRCAFDVCFACSLNVETSETGSFKWALLVSPWWWRLKVVGFETVRSKDQ